MWANIRKRLRTHVARAARHCHHTINTRKEIFEKLRAKFNLSALSGARRPLKLIARLM